MNSTQSGDVNKSLHLRRLHASSPYSQILNRRTCHLGVVRDATRVNYRVVDDSYEPFSEFAPHEQLSERAGRAVHGGVGQPPPPVVYRPNPEASRHMVRGTWGVDATAHFVSKPNFDITSNCFSSRSARFLEFLALSASDDAKRDSLSSRSGSRRETQKRRNIRELRRLLREDHPLLTTVYIEP